jgi:prepilin-type N-terminal cleavage/methylation domain-containing protein
MLRAWHRVRHSRRGFTMVELIVVLAAIAILAAILTPMVLKLIDDSRISRAEREVEGIANALATLYKDTSEWPYTNANGPSGTIDRLIGSNSVATGAGVGAGSGAANWGAFGTSKRIGDFLYWNNPDNDSNANGNNSNQNNQDYPTTGPTAWTGPYMEAYDLNDPWGNAYVVNVRYLPNGNYGGTVRHKTIVLSAGPDGVWQTPFSDTVTEEVMGDDIGHILHVR